MSSVVIELTNRCNLACDHCMDATRRSDSDLKVEIIEKVLQDAGAHGINFISYTGGEPTIHPQFTDILRMTAESGYNFGFVSNGWNFSRTYDKVLPFMDRFSGVTFSMDGASEETHDKRRGKGSFRKLMQAVSICVLKGIEFTFNTVITTGNQYELQETAELATQLGARAIRFSHLMPTPVTTARSLDLSHDERIKVESRIDEIRNSVNIPVLMSEVYSATKGFSCAPLLMKEMGIDWSGNVILCYSLYAHKDNGGKKGGMFNLLDMSFSEAYERRAEAIRKLDESMKIHSTSQNVYDADFSRCRHCLNYIDKLD